MLSIAITSGRNELTRRLVLRSAPTVWAASTRSDITRSITGPDRRRIRRAETHPVNATLNRYLHFSSCLLEEAAAEMSAKEKKKALKAKAKVAAAEAAAADAKDGDELDAKKAAASQKVAAKKAAKQKEGLDSPPPSSEAAPSDASILKDSATPLTPPTSIASSDAAAPAVEAAVGATQPVSEASTVAEEAIAASSDASSATIEYSTLNLTHDAAAHQAGLADPDTPSYQNPLHHQQELPILKEDFASEADFQAAQVPLPPFTDEAGNVVAPQYIQELADEIVHLNMLEMNELVNKIGHHFGFHEGMLSPAGAASGGDAMADDGFDEADGPTTGAGAAAAPEKTSFDVKLVGFDEKAKIKVIKEVRALAGLGLKEAKELVEGAPKTVVTGIKREQADEIKAKLEELGAKIEIV